MPRSALQTALTFDKVDRRNKAIVTVDDRETVQMLQRTMQVLAGDSLERFLDGPAHDYLEEEIVNRFAYAGDQKSGHWPDLATSTNRIRRSLGYSEDEINIRSGDMFEMLTEDRDTHVTGSHSAVMILPGSAASGVLREKLITAQQGRTKNPLPGAGPTPARPVLAVDEDDLEALLERLSRYITWELVGSFL